MAIRLHVVGIDVSDHREHRLQHEEGSVGLIGLGNQKFAFAQARIGAGGQQPTTDDEGRIEAPLGKDARD